MNTNSSSGKTTFAFGVLLQAGFFLSVVMLKLKDAIVNLRHFNYEWPQPISFRGETFTAYLIITGICLAGGLLLTYFCRVSAPSTSRLALYGVAANALSLLISSSMLMTQLAVLL